MEETMAEAQEETILGDAFNVENEDFESISTELEDSQEILQHIPTIRVVDPKKEHPVGMIVDMTIEVSCPDCCDLRGSTVLIGDVCDQVVAEQTLVGYDEENGVNTTGSFSVEMPKEEGDHTWTIVFYPSESNPEELDEELGDSNENDQYSEDLVADAQHAIVQIEYTFKTVKHITGMSVWRNSGEPVPVGDEYLLNVGVNCLLGCSLLGQTVSVYHDGALLASAVVGEPAPPLESLFYAQVPLKAPDKVGMFALECRLEPEGLDLSHTSNSFRYILTTNKRAQCRLNLAAISEEDSAPLALADFVVRPKDGFAAFLRSGEDGKVSIGMPYGDVYIEANCDNRKDANASITIPEGQEEYELTLALAWEPRRLD